MIKRAILSPCRTWRYVLTRKWDANLWSSSLPTAMFIGLNPSTGDEIEDDPTIRLCINFAKSLGCGEIEMLNLFAFRSKNPKIMKAQQDPIGPDNDKYLIRYALTSNFVIAVWGNDGIYLNRQAKVLSLLQSINVDPYCFGITGSGQPKHLLYLKGDTKLMPYKIG